MIQADIERLDHENERIKKKKMKIIPAVVRKMA